MYGAIASAAGGVIGGLGTIIDDLFTSDEERLTKEIVKQRIAQKPHLENFKILQTEAAHRSVFVAGWRPFVGWVCGFSLLYSFVLQGIVIWAMAIFWPNIPPPPMISTGPLLTILLGMLGLGGMRSFEKVKGLTK